MLLLLSLIALGLAIQMANHLSRSARIDDAQRARIADLEARIADTEQQATQATLKAAQATMALAEAAADQQAHYARGFAAGQQYETAALRTQLHAALANQQRMYAQGYEDATQQLNAEVERRIQQARSRARTEVLVELSALSEQGERWHMCA